MRDDAEKEWEQFRDATCEVAEQKMDIKKERKEMDNPCHTGKTGRRPAKIEFNQDILDTPKKHKFIKVKKELEKKGSLKTKIGTASREEQIQEMEEVGRRRDSKKLFSTINKLVEKITGKLIGMKPFKNLKRKVLTEKQDVVNI